MLAARFRCALKLRRIGITHARCYNLGTHMAVIVTERKPMKKGSKKSGKVGGQKGHALCVCECICVWFFAEHYI